MGEEAKWFPLGFAANPPGGEMSPSLEGLHALLTDATTLPGGETNPKLAGLTFLRATGEDVLSTLAFRQLSAVILPSTLEVGVGL